MFQQSNSNMFSLMETLSQNYAKAYRDYCEATHGFMPFMQKSGSSARKSQEDGADDMAFPYMNWADPSIWKQMPGMPQQAMFSQFMNAFPNDPNMNTAMQRHFSRKNMMNMESWMELMPVLMLLAQGNMLKNYLVGPQRTMLDAFLEGFAKGSPELHRDTEEARNPILDAQEAFWSQMMAASNPMMSATNPMLDFWTNAMKETGTPSAATNGNSDKSRVQRNRSQKSEQAAAAKRASQRSTQSTKSEPHMPTLTEGLAAMQQAQGEAWQQYCNVFWPTLSHR
ncbi:hypothetical protein GCM10007094_08710 [Pseudovibrio japonicus]|uniref:Uncharacterized protein n=1 Tax=Pseudovibrio japonicus TaxID=366534 RepID=A0ABQ3E459_9HYPH|nr:hypothetical protein [Pseudovibrio japonicus]GHB22756.1 hypothetical protein GCM10007094_08710 [Pseudovibrio japonicus]